MVLLSILQSHTYTNRCFFHVWFLSTFDCKEDLLFEATLADAAAFPNKVANVRNTPTHWFPADHSWLVCTDYDLTFTTAAASKCLAHLDFPHFRLSESLNKAPRRYAHAQ